jgi:hypothetical protein
MSNPSETRRPSSDACLLGYSAEHVVYEFDMFLWVARAFEGGTTHIGAPTPADVSRLKNVLVESFALHLRNVIDFLYDEKHYPTDVIAEDFLEPGGWAGIRPPMTKTLEDARERANKEVAHLTTLRIGGNPAGKTWGVADLANEVRPLMRKFAESALPTRPSPKVVTAPRRG